MIVDHRKGKVLVDGQEWEPADARELAILCASPVEIRHGHHGADPFEIRHGHQKGWYSVTTPGMTRPIAFRFKQEFENLANSLVLYASKAENEKTQDRLAQLMKLIEKADRESRIDQETRRP